MALDTVSRRVGISGRACRVSTEGPPLFPATDCRVSAASDAGWMDCCSSCDAAVACKEVDGEGATNADVVGCVAWKMVDGKPPGSNLVASKGLCGRWKGIDPDRMPGIKSVPCMTQPNDQVSDAEGSA